MTRVILKKWLSLQFIVAGALAVGAVAQEGEPSIIVLFGDSITVGENITSYINGECPAAGGSRPGFGGGRTDFCTPDKELERILDQSKRDSTVVNYGHGGTPTGPPGTPFLENNNNGLNRIHGALSETLNQFDGSQYIAVIFYGTNDPNWEIPVDVTKQNIKTMVEIARDDYGFTPIVGNLLPRNSRNVNSIENPKIREAAIETGAIFVDQYSNFVAQDAIDDGIANNLSLHDLERSSRTNAIIRLHPSKEGYTVVAQHWFDATLQQLIEPKDDAVVAPIIMLLLDDEEQP